jgi:hypothetical protein
MHTDRKVGDVQVHTGKKVEGAASSGKKGEITNLIQSFNRLWFERGREFRDFLQFLSVLIQVTILLLVTYYQTSPGSITLSWESCPKAGNHLISEWLTYHDYVLP